MIQEFVNLYMDNKDNLEKEFSKKHIYNYMDIVKAVITILNVDSDSPSPDRITEIDYGDYQGTLMYVIGAEWYQPKEFWYVKVAYGSCSTCDTLQGINDCGNTTIPTKTQVADYMTLALHIVQGLKRTSDDVA